MTEFFFIFIANDMVWNVILCNLFYFQFDFLFLLLFYDTNWLAGWQVGYTVMCRWLGCCAMLNAAECLTDSDCIRIYDILIWCQVIRLKIPSFRPIINLISLWCPLMLWCYALCHAVLRRVVGLEQYDTEVIYVVSSLRSMDPMPLLIGRWAHMQ